MSQRHIWEEEVQLHSFLILALDGGEWLTSRPGHVPSFPFNRRLGKPQNQSGHFLSLPGFEPDPSSLQQVTIPTILLKLLPNCQVTTRNQISQMQPVAFPFDTPVVYATIPGLFIQVLILVINAVI